ncbi:hypothetical protein NP493_1167g00034 [Ridgeia piscesae]|uniref:J domain-containing protein n=1 Tax=Ridgeia piscesae TaxID=27915 RepID=A0AAD9KEY5_RIDPI|nr:hypothetical protein NP493_1167g00034 [Ridgeia piscesae]
MAGLQVLLICLVVTIFPSVVHGYIEGLYCGIENCYELLGVTREQPRKAKETAHEMFMKIANAYEILKDEESRKDYDYMLDNPEEYYAHYYRYYRRRVAPRVDVRLVVAVCITAISLIQYWSAWNNYNQAIAYLITVPKYRMQAQDIARQEGLLQDKKKRDRNKTKEEIREEEENILKTVLINKMDIKGGYEKPTVYDILWVQLTLSPYYLVCYIAWFVRWIWKFTICREEYGDEEREYLIRKKMKLSSLQWDEWKARKDEEMKAELAQNARYKSYRRYMKKGGPGQMTFGPE